jgi:CxxC motif-containing protein (DUF1111 family)
MKRRQWKVVVAILVVLLLGVSQTLQAQLTRARDPGPRVDRGASGEMYAGLTDAERGMFEAGKEEFAAEEEVDEGIGPRFNFVSCSGCHAHPEVGGTSPRDNPLFRVPTDLGFTANTIPSFITPRGPIREARFQFNADGSRDGGVHALFVISGHKDAGGCNLRQPDFERQLRNNNVVFRIPTPVFGAGLIEQITDSAIVSNLGANSQAKRALGISGRVNRSGNDGTITRFGWKAQNKSLLIFSGEAYNVEMGITSEAFQQEREENPECQFAKVPNDITASTGQIGAIEHFANFQRFLAPPRPHNSNPGGGPSISRGRTLFGSVGCALCHTSTLRTGESTVEALRNKPVHLYSDLALHQMGPGLADDILQGAARGDEWRTAPLWGLGQRIFFMHDGRTDDLAEAIRAHRSAGNRQFGPSEANAVIDRYNGLSEGDKQDMLNFLRSL